MIAIYFTGRCIDALGRRHFTRYAATNYLPGRPEGEYGDLVRAQNYFALPPARVHVFEDEPNADDLRAFFYGGASR